MLANIKEFVFQELLVESSNSMVFRAQKKVDGSNVIIKMPKSERSIDNSSEQLVNEYELLKSIDSRHVIQALYLVPIQNSQILVLEDFPSKNLAWLIEEENLDLLTALDIAIEIAEAVGAIHHENIIHRDIKPQNILVDLETKKLKIIDFGTASFLTHDISEKTAPEQLKGSIHYMSPEQTGRMNREMDYRSDLYSVGVTLYQLFTKVLPFDSESPLEILHAHIAQQPIPPSERNPDIPEVISNIILKCLSKQAENRYHSSFGLKKDLEKCRKLMLETSEIEVFPLGELDVFDHWHLPERLYGRQKELNFITQAYSEVMEGAFLLLTISGYEGVGKTRLVVEARDTIAAKKGRFVTANFDQFKRNKLYGGWVQIFTNLINQILAETDENLAEWKGRIQEAIGDNGQVIADVIPEIKWIIGETAPIAKLSPIENENRFIYTISTFLKSLLSPNRPLVLFFDNVQWADEPSLKLLDQFFIDQTIHSLMIILAYRDNEIDSYHPLHIALKEITSQPIKNYSLHLHPLPQGLIHEMIKDSFVGPPKQMEKLAALIYRKTQGNPFFALQFLKYLNEEKLFYFDQEHCCWMANLEAIEHENVSDNVADLMIENFKKLDPAIVDLLKLCSLLENKFSSDVIAQITHISKDNAARLLKEAMKFELICQEKRENPSQPICYRFVHERIKNAAYSLLTEEQKQKTHYEIGSYLLKNTPEYQLSANCIEIVNHLNNGFDPGTHENNKKQLIELNYLAGNKAKDSVAYLPAIQYFSKAISWLKPNAWETDYELTMNLHSNLALCQQITGGAKQAQQLFDLCLSKAKTVTEKAEMYFLTMSLDSQFQNFDRVFENAKKGLKLLGYHFDTKPSKLSIIKDLLLLKCKLMFRNLGDQFKLPRATDHRILYISKLLSGAQYPAFVTGNKNLFLKNALQSVNLTLKYGMMQQSAPGLSTYAMVLSSMMLHDYASSIKIDDAAMKMTGMYPKTVESAGSLYMHYAFIYRWQNPLKDSVFGLKFAYRNALESGLLYIAAATAVYIPMVGLVTGEKLSTVLDNINESLKEIGKFKAVSEQLSLTVHREVCRALLGETPDPTDPRPPELTDELLSQENTNKNLLYALRYELWHTVLLYLFGRYQEAHSVAKRILTKADNYPNWIEWHIFYFFHSLTLAALITDPKKQSQEYQILLNHQKILKKWAKASPFNYAHQALIVDTEIRRINEEGDQLIKGYDEAIKAAKKNGTTQDIAIAYELCAKYHLSLGANEIASFYLLKSLQYFSQWGATSKCIQFRNLYSEHLGPQSFALSMAKDEKLFDDHGTISQRAKLSDFYGQSQNNDFEVSALIESSQALSKEIFLDKLMESLMHVVIVHAGADKAFLLLEDKGKLLVYSESCLNQKYVPILTPQKVEDRNEDLCSGIVKYVARTKKEVILNDACNSGNFRYDPYVLCKKPKSILCIPLIQKDNLKGVLYLENSASIGAFTSNRTRLLILLSSQMAISLENAQFYANLEVKVNERTKELQQRNKELQEALRMIKTVQTQMIQQEKLASLGLLTSGIAHELKNPLNFVINFSHIANENLQELLQELTKKELQQDTKELITELTESLTKIDLHGKRADSIIKGMLAHAHHGSVKAELADINALVEQSLNLTFHTYRKKDANFNLKINRNYDKNIKLIPVFSGDLLRVFINVIDNACYAMLEKIKSNPNYQPVFDLTTHFDKDYVLIKLRDNGPGIPQNVIDKVFDPFFTTKPTETGTGLGLSIVYDVITKQHMGKIELRSEPNEFTEVLITLPSNEKVGAQHET